MVFFNSKKLIDQVIKDIDESQSSIDIEVYIWDPDEVGRLFEEALFRAVDRGVKVRVIVDRIGSLAWISGGRMDKIVQRGVQVRIFRPLLGFKVICQFFPKSFYAIWSAVNRRNHRKTFIIDKKIFYIGSLNIMQPALQWKEITTRESSPEVIELLGYIFNCTWDWLRDDGHWFKKYDLKSLILKVEKSDRITTTQSRVLRIQYKNDFLHKINNSQKRIWLITPYFNPPGFLLKALVAAAKRKVDVRLLVPENTVPAWFKFLSRLYYSHLLKKGIRVYEYAPAMLHAKTTLFDSEGIIGTGNLNYRSFYLDLELNLTIRDSEDLSALHEEFTKDMAKSREIKLPSEVKMWERVFGSFLTIFKTSF